MKLSTKSRYGTRLMLDMAQHYQDGPIHLANVAKRQGISVKYLEQIIIPLKKANYIQSVRGPRKRLRWGKSWHCWKIAPAWQRVRTTPWFASVPLTARRATSGRRRRRLCLTNCAPLPWLIC